MLFLPEKSWKLGSAFLNLSLKWKNSIIVPLTAATVAWAQRHRPLLWLYVFLLHAKNYTTSFSRVWKLLGLFTYVFFRQFIHKNLGPPSTINNSQKRFKWQRSLFTISFNPLWNSQIHCPQSIPEVWTIGPPMGNTFVFKKKSMYLGHPHLWILNQRPKYRNGHTMFGSHWCPYAFFNVRAWPVDP